VVATGVRARASAGVEKSGDKFLGSHMLLC
jgi:hypothetical protein